MSSYQQTSCALTASAHLHADSTKVRQSCIACSSLQMASSYRYALLSVPCMLSALAEGIWPECPFRSHASQTAVQMLYYTLDMPLYKSSCYPNARFSSTMHVGCALLAHSASSLCASHTSSIVPIHLLSCMLLQGGLTDLWLDDPYVVAAKKLLQWATEANEKGDVYPVSMRLCYRFKAAQRLSAPWLALCQAHVVRSLKRLELALRRARPVSAAIQICSLLCT